MTALTTNLDAATHLRHLEDAHSRAHVRTQLGLTIAAYRTVWRNQPAPAAVHAAILNLPHPLKDHELHARHHATGSRRRLRALAHRGFPNANLATYIRWPHDDFHRFINAPRPETTFGHTRSDHARIRALYDMLWDQDPTTHGGVTPAMAHHARTYARKKQWRGPLHWDDDTIDDSSARPQTGNDYDGERGPDMAAVTRALGGERIKLSDRDRAHAVVLAYRLDRFADRAAIADTLHSTPDAVGRAWERGKNAAREAGEPWITHTLPYLDTVAVGERDTNDPWSTIRYTRPVDRRTHAA